MEEEWETRIKKLALAYKTGWQYQPGTDEAGSVLTDIFLEMERENQRRYQKISEKHRRRFLSAAPNPRPQPERLKTVLRVRTPEKSDGMWLPEDTQVYTVPAEGGLVRFRTVSPLKLTAARLCYAIYRSGFRAWLTDVGEGEAPLSFFLPEGQPIACPDFRWYFRGLCDGRGNFCFAVKFKEAGESLPELKGEWKLCRGQVAVSLEWRQSEKGSFLSGESAVFENCLDSGIYELCFCAGQAPDAAWLPALYGGFALEEAPENSAPKWCLTDAGGQSAEKVLPFGRMLDEASCCYFVCDRMVAGRSGEITLRFTQRFEKEERLPAPMPEEYKKMYKKYPWLQQTGEVLDWSVKESVWEYFNGNFWCVLPESQGWKTGQYPEGEMRGNECRPEGNVKKTGGSPEEEAKKTDSCMEEEAKKTDGSPEGEAKDPDRHFEGEQVCRFEKPNDMRTCIVEGEEHFFIRLRLVRVQNAYSAYYRKYIPVMEDVRFSAGARRIEAEGYRLPKREWAGEKKMYLGFDREITVQNRWYTGGEWRSFAQGQIKGWGSRFGRDAFWVELAEEKAEVLTGFCPNCVEVLQILPEEDEDGKLPEEIPASSLFFVETEELGVLEAVSLADAITGAKVRDAFPAPQKPHREKGNYFSHYGRLVTRMDLEIFMQERFPQLRLVSCSFTESSKEFFVTVQTDAKELLPELEAWLKNLLPKVGGLWFDGVLIRCALAKTGQDGA